MRFCLFFASLTFLASPARAEEHWAYLPPVAVKVPDAASVHPIDALLAAAWKKADLKPAEIATQRRWIERAAYTLTGLPPTAAQLARIEANPCLGVR